VVDELGQPTLNTAWHDSQIEILPSGEVKARVWNLPAISLGTASFGAWHHAVLRYNRATQSLDGFLDGVRSPSSSSGDRLAPQEYGYAQHYALGAIDTTNLGSGGWFKGSIDEFAVYPTALSDARIAAHYVAASQATAPASGTATTAGQGPRILAASHRQSPL